MVCLLLTNSLCLCSHGGSFNGEALLPLVERFLQDRDALAVLQREWCETAQLTATSRLIAQTVIRVSDGGAQQQQPQQRAADMYTSKPPLFDGRGTDAHVFSHADAPVFLTSVLQHQQSVAEERLHRTATLHAPLLAQLNGALIDLYRALSATPAAAQHATDMHATGPSASRSLMPASLNAAACDQQSALLESIMLLRACYHSVCLAVLDRKVSIL